MQKHRSKTSQTKPSIYIYIYLIYIYIHEKNAVVNTQTSEAKTPHRKNSKNHKTQTASTVDNEAHSPFFLLKWGKSCRRFRGVKRTVTHTEKLPCSVSETNSAPLSEGKVGGAGGSKTQIHTKVENPPSLPMEAYLESQWPPLHRFHN